MNVAPLPEGTQAASSTDAPAQPPQQNINPGHAAPPIADMQQAQSKTIAPPAEITAAPEKMQAPSQAELQKPTTEQASVNTDSRSRSPRLMQRSSRH